MMKRIIALALMLSLLSSLAGCMITEDYPPPMELSDAMPPSQGEGEEMDSFEATLYFLSSDKKDFKTETRTVYYGGEVSRAHAIINALTEGPKNYATQRSIPSWMGVTRIEQSGDVCNVFFEGMYIPDDETWLKLRASVAASLMATEEIKTVNTRFFEVEMGCHGYPYGGVEAPDDLSLYVRSAKNAFSSYLPFGSGIEIDEDTEYLTQTATLYFPVRGEDALLGARGVEITYPERISRSELAALLIETLAAGDPDGEYDMPLPEGFALVCPPVVRYNDVTETGEPNENGTCTIAIVIEPLQEDFDETALCGILTMTVAGFVPNVTGVTVSFGEMTETGSETPQPAPASGTEREDVLPQRELTIIKTLGNKIHTYSEYADSIGDVVHVYYPDADGNVLFAVLRLVPWTKIYDPLVRLEELFSGSAEPGVPYSAFSADDIASIYVKDGIAVLDWKEGFSEKMRAYLDGDGPIAADRRESMLIYGIVNTLTEIPEVSSVWMLEDGKKLGAIENIYLGNKLVRNPGLIVEKE